MVGTGLFFHDAAKAGNERYSRFRVAVRGIDAVEWLFPHRGPHGQVFVRGVEVKAALHAFRRGTETLNLL
jgi:hypothetical protein